MTSIQKIKSRADTAVDWYIEQGAVHLYWVKCLLRGIDVKIYGDLISGNCLKVKYVADYLGHEYQWVTVDVVEGGARTSEMLAKNPAGQVPFIELHDGRIFGAV